MSLEHRKVYCRAVKGDGWLMPLKSLKLPKDLARHFFKKPSEEREGITGSVISLPTILWSADGVVTGGVAGIHIISL